VLVCTESTGRRERLSFRGAITLVADMGHDVQGCCACEWSGKHAATVTDLVFDFGASCHKLDPVPGRLQGHKISQPSLHPTMVTAPENDDQGYVQIFTTEHPLTAENFSELRLTSEEKEEIKDKGRWLRRIANPFVDFYVIIAIGAAGSPTTAEVARRREDKQIRDYAQDL
jgi:hypothetical protein